MERGVHFIVVQSCQLFVTSRTAACLVPCPSLSSRTCSNSHPLSQWCHSIILSFVIPLSCLQSFPASWSLLMTQLFASGGQIIGTSASVLPMNIQYWFPLVDWCDLLAIQGTVKSLLQHHSSKASILQHSDFFFPLIFISWRLITLQYCSGFCHTLTWTQPWIYMYSPSRSPPAPRHIPLHPIPLGLPSAPGWSTCLMHPAWAGDLFHPRLYTCFDAVLSKCPTLAFSHRVQNSVLYICVSFSVLHIGLSLPSF